MDILEGTIERIIFRNEENFYTVARFEPSKNGSSITVIGHFTSISVGENYRLEGEWVVHKTYGKQFSVTIYEEMLPTSEYGIEKYLASGMIKGIGPKMASRLIGHFGSSIFDVLENEPERLREVEGIGKKKAGKILTSFNAQRQMKNIMTYLSGFDITPAYALKIYQKYGNDCVAILRNNPYQLAEDIWGIGFKIADKIARKMGLPMDSPYRVTAFIIYTLQEATGNGHLFLEKNTMMEIIARDLGVSAELAEETVLQMKEDGKIVIDNEAVYLKILYYLECGIAKRLEVFSEIKPLAGPSPEEISDIENRIGVKLSASQREALYQVFSSGMVIITGGPGTGKTTTIKSIILWAEKMELSYSLAAPTGRAAKRLSEATGGRKATTIHRLLGFIPGESEFMHNEEEPLDADIVIIDEASMIDVYLFNSLLKGISPETRIILVGDIDQLPSVGPGNVLSDLIGSGLFKTIYLKTIFRQAVESYIILNSHRINRGEFPLLKDGTDFIFLEVEEPEEIAKMIITLCAYDLKDYYADPVDSIQIISPMHRGPIGVKNLNEELQKILNPPDSSKLEVKHGTSVFREGDKVMQIVNNYKRQVFNGDLGRIVEIDREEQVIWVRLIGDNVVVDYEYQDLGELVLAYACTIHKSQGSEYPVVILTLVNGHYIMLQRNLLYTAITRAKQRVILVGTSEALRTAVANDRTRRRHSLLAERLRREVFL